MDAHGLLLEMQAEMQQLSDPNVTHIGIGFAEDSTKVLVVELLSQSPLMVNTIQQAEDGSIHVEGLNMDPSNAGLYAARIVSSTNDKKVAQVVGPANMAYDKATHMYSISFDPPAEEVFYAQDPKWLELFIRRRQIDTIPYGQPSNEKIKVQDLEQALRLPMEYLPDPRVVKEDQHDAEQYERDARERAERAEEERLIRVAQLQAKKEEQAKKREALLAERQQNAGSGDEDGSDEDMSGSDKVSGSGSRSGASGTHGKSSQKKSKSGGRSQGQSESRGNKSMVDSNEEGSDEDFGEDGEGSDEEYDGGIGDLPSQPAMKRELI